MKWTMLTLLFATAMPGLHRVVLFFIIARAFDPITLGRFSNDYYVIQTLMIFTVMGPAGLLLMRLPKLSATASARYFRQTLSLFWLAVLLCVPIIGALASLGTVYAGGGALLLMLGMGANVLMRHRCMAHKHYDSLFLYDAALLLGLLGLLVIPGPAIYIASGIYLSVVAVYLLRTAAWRPHLQLPDPTDRAQMLNVILINVFSGGILYTLVPVINTHLGEHYAALLGMIFVLASVVMLAPRALSLYLLPDLAKHHGDPAILDATYAGFKRLNIRILLAIALCMLLALPLVSHVLVPELFTLPYSRPLYGAIIAMFLIGQLSLPASNYLLATEQTGTLLRAGLGVLLLYGAGYGLLLTLDVAAIFFVFALIGGLCTAFFLRFYHLDAAVRQRQNACVS